jgi:hypothetical protein
MYFIPGSQNPSDGNEEEFTLPLLAGRLLKT